MRIESLTAPAALPETATPGHEGENAPESGSFSAVIDQMAGQSEAAKRMERSFRERGVREEDRAEDRASTIPVPVPHPFLPDSEVRASRISAQSHRDAGKDEATDRSDPAESGSGTPVIAASAPAREPAPAGKAGEAGAAPSALSEKAGMDVSPTPEPEKGLGVAPSSRDDATVDETGAQRGLELPFTNMARESALMAGNVISGDRVENGASAATEVPSATGSVTAGSQTPALSASGTGAGGQEQESQLRMPVSSESEAVEHRSFVTAGPTAAPETAAQDSRLHQRILDADSKIGEASAAKPAQEAGIDPSGMTRDLLDVAAVIEAPGISEPMPQDSLAQGEFDDQTSMPKETGSTQGNQPSDQPGAEVMVPADVDAASEPMAQLPSTPSAQAVTEVPTVSLGESALRAKRKSNPENDEVRPAARAPRTVSRRGSEENIAMSAGVSTTTTSSKGSPAVVEKILNPEAPEEPETDISETNANSQSDSQSDSVQALESRQPDPGPATIDAAEFVWEDMQSVQRMLFHGMAVRTCSSEGPAFAGPRPFHQSSSTSSTSWAAGLSLPPQVAGTDLKGLIAMLAPKHTGPSQIPEFLSQLTDRIQTQLRDNENIIRIQLKPGSMGRMEIKAETSAAGVLATIVTESANVREYLEHNLHMLQQSFQDQGLKVDRINVTVQQDFWSQHAASGQQESSADSHAQESGLRRGTGRGPSPKADELILDAQTLGILNPHGTFHAIA
jgi:flagellar hook-length control protein FliK